MKETTTTVEMDERGRLTLPKPTRKALGVEGSSAVVEVTVRVEE